MAGIFSDANGGILGGADPGTLGLLAAAFKGMDASGPSVGVPVSLGQVIGRAGQAGVGTYASALEAQRKAAQTQAFIELEKQKVASEAEKLRQSLQQDQMRQEILRRYGVIGGGNQPQGQVGVSDTTAAGLGAPWAASGNIPQPQATQGPAGGVAALLRDPNAVMALKLAGVGDMTDLFKHVNTPQVLKPGDYAIPRDGSAPFGLPTEKGVQITPNGVGLVPGAMGVNNSLNLSQQAAQAAYAPPIIRPGQGNNPPQYINQAAMAVQGGAPNVLGLGGPPVPQGLGGPAPAPAPVPVPGPRPGWDVPPEPKGSPADLKRTADKIKLIEGEIAAEVKLAEDNKDNPMQYQVHLKNVEDLKRELSMLRPAPPDNRDARDLKLAAGPSPAQVSADEAKKSFDIRSAEDEVKQLGEIRTQADAAKKAISDFSYQRDLISRGIRGGRLAVGVQPASEFMLSLGLMTEEQAQKTRDTQNFVRISEASALSQLKALVGSTNISDADRKAVEAIVPRLVDDPKARLEFINFMEHKANQSLLREKSAEDYVKQNGRLRGFDFTSKPFDSQLPTAAAVNALKMNPRLADEFDKKYGRGAAAVYTGK